MFGDRDSFTAGRNAEPPAGLRRVSPKTIKRGIGRDHRDGRQPSTPGLGGDDGANKFCRGRGTHATVAAYFFL